MSRLLAFAALAATLVLGCEASPPQVSGAASTALAATVTPTLPASTKETFGAPITEQTTTALSEIVKEPSRYSGQTVRTEGTVGAVCQMAGCWMQIEDPSGLVHVKMAGHSFAVPKSSTGRRAVVQGKVVSTNQPGAACGNDNCNQGLETAKLELEATGVSFVD